MIVLVAATLTHSQTLAAQQHEHADAPSRNARLELMLGGPHLILYHRGYLALGDAQISGLQRLRRSVCDAELVFVQQSTMWRDRLTHILDDTASLPPRPTRDAASPPPRQTLDAAKPSPLHDAMLGLAFAESQWLTELLHARRDALALLSAQQRAQLSALREHWIRESNAMVEEATRPGQRGHPGTQIPIRVPGMVVHETTLLPHCEALHGPSRHIVIPPPG